MSFSKKLEEVKAEVLDSGIKVVSFDLFDTLVLRPCIEPSDLFKIVAKRCNYEGDFVSARRMAEQYARKKKLFYYDDITLEEIYREFAILTTISEEQAYDIMQYELDVEYDYIYPRYSIRELYNLAKENGKKVIIVTDIYLPKEFIEKVLEKNEISGYHQLYVSSEERLSKGTGRLFQKVIAECNRDGIEKESIIHLGDNQKADITMGKKMGIKTVYLPKTIGILDSKKLFKPLYQFGSRTDSCYLVGTLANYLFDDPFFPLNINSLSGGNEKVFGAVLYGPILLVYTKWLMEACCKNNVDKILFVMRDGFIIEKIYKMLSDIYGKTPDVDTIYLSRMIRYYFRGKEKNGLMNSFSQFPIPENMTVEEFMEKRLLLNDEEKMEIWKKFQAVGYADISSPMGKPVQYYLLMPELQKVFAEKTEEQAEIIQNYCKAKTKDSNHLAVVDVGYRGSASRFLYDEMQIKNIGLQMLEIPSMQEYSSRDYHIESFYSYSYKCKIDAKILHPLTEDIISIQEGTAVGIEKVDNEFKIIKQKSEIENPIITEAQNGILEYIEYTINILKKDFINFRFDSTIFFDMLLDFLKQPNEIDSSIIKKLSFQESDFIKITSDKNIYAQWTKEKIRKTPSLTKIMDEVSQNKSVTEEEEDRPWERISKPHLFAIKLCESLGILDVAIQVKRKIRKKRIVKEENTTLIDSLFKTSMEQSLITISEKKLDIKTDKEKILVAGHMTSFDKGSCNFLNQLNEHMADFEFVLMSEWLHISEERTREKIRFPFFLVPQFLEKNWYATNTGLLCDKKIKQYIDQKENMKWGVENLLRRHKDIEENYAYLMVYYAEIFLNRMLDMIKPQYVIIWNEFYAYHHLLKAICKEKGIDIYYMEFGSLPGTISIEHLGQMGKSFPGQYSEEFRNLPVSQGDLKQAENVLQFLKESRANRNIQPINNEIEEIKKKLKPGRPVLLYAGVNDFESGLVPYTNETREFHSPFLHTSDEVLGVLADYAAEMDWNLIYKPHPLFVQYLNVDIPIDSNVILAKNVDINDVIDISTVVVTILSQVSYIALIRNKPVVMLGYTQLRGKGCCYEAFELKRIKESLVEAVAAGFTDHMQNEFKRHIAQMLRYNLFDDLTIKPVQYGQSAEAAARFIRCHSDDVDWYSKLESHVTEDRRKEEISDTVWGGGRKVIVQYGQKNGI